MTGRIRVGIGGWSYEPWRETFYPKDVKQKDELRYASRQVTTIEINATYYGSQKPQTFANWAASVPEDFRFALKASRFATNRKVLGEAGESVAKFLNQGITELGGKLGPILWQLAPTKRFDPDDMAAFLALLPESQDSCPLRHAIEPRHESFCDPAFVALARKHGVAVVQADHEEYPLIPERTSGFTYARLMRAEADIVTGYADAALDGWAKQAQAWAVDGDAYVFMINGAKERAPAAAVALLRKLAG